MHTERVDLAAAGPCTGLRQHVLRPGARLGP